MPSALVPGVVAVVVAVIAGSRYLARRRLSKLQVSGGRMSLVLNLMDRRAR
jgi:hypothetical protein